MNRQTITKFLTTVLLLLLSNAVAVAAPPNVLIVTVDDMSADSLGEFGSRLADTSPNIDAFIRQSLKFHHAHVQVGNCMPGRNIMWSGLYSHKNGVEGFVQNKAARHAMISDVARNAGYFTAIRGKASHSTPYHPYAWDADVTKDTDGKDRHIKDAVSYGDSARDAISMAGKANKPFFLLLNISDPHKPFYSKTRDGKPDPHVPSRVFSADEVPVPGFLPEDELIRAELALYYSSVRRADDCFGEVMKALDESGHADDTFVMFLSDHGMPLPFAKTQLYYHSTHTPLAVRWPGVTKPGTHDKRHMVSCIDFMPTLVDVMETTHPEPETLQGRSFASVIRGEEQDNRDAVLLQYNENSGRWRHPMRGIQTREFLYLYNIWSDGVRKFATATTSTDAYRQMVKRAKSEPAIAARLQLFDHRVPHELFDVQKDPNCLNNLADDPDYRATLESLQSKLATELQRTQDPAAGVMKSPNDEQLRAAYMAIEDKRSADARNRRRKAKTQSQANRKKLSDAIRLDVPANLSRGRQFTVAVHHKLPADIGKQKLYVTLRSKSGTRIKRKVVQVAGEGVANVAFRIGPKVKADNVVLAAFVGEDFESNLQHVVSAAVAVK